MTGFLGEPGLRLTDEDRAVAALSELLAVRRGFSVAEAKLVRAAALLHDIGKAGIDPGILRKAGKLTPREFETVKTHTVIGAEMLDGLHGGLGDVARNVCLYHHEQWDGGGYWGIRASALPPYVPIVTVCDVYMALVSARPYKAAWPPADALSYIERKAGTRFSYDLVEDFLRLVSGGAADAIV